MIPQSSPLLRGASFLSLLLPVLVSADEGTAWVTPHESYSSSVGVLGCKVNTNRIAYWPNSIDCTNLCVELSYEDRKVHLLRIDQSEGAHDVSYDAWNYLLTGYSATEKPVAGGATAMTYKDVDISMCADIIHTAEGKLPLSASNSMNFVADCLGKKDSWVGKNYELYNILDPLCLWGNDEVCQLDWEGGKNQADCPSGIGTPSVLGDSKEETTVWNIQYPSGKKVKAGAAPEPAGPGVAWDTGEKKDLANGLGVAKGMFGATVLGWMAWVML
ncbi:hypothetical protein V8F33_010835 [Rhypophila sp. PSN 637]